MRSRHFATLVLAAVLAVPLAACSAPSSSPSADDKAKEVVKSLGAVPVPTAPSSEPTATAGPSHAAVLAMGAPVSVTLPDGAKAVLTALGPDTVPVPLPTAVPTAAPDVPIEGTITLKIQMTSGSLTVGLADLSCRDQMGQEVALNAVGPATATVAAGSQAELTVHGTFHSGAAQITLRHAGQVAALWTFSIEND